MQKGSENHQRNHWDATYEATLDFFGHEPSEFGKGAMRTFQANGAKRILELGCGQGRDTIMFLKHGLEVIALDYSETAIEHLVDKARKLGLDKKLVAKVHDAREGVPLSDGAVDGVFSHMFFTMHLNEKELSHIFQECLRAMRPGGLNIYSVRNINDPHYGEGAHHGEDMWENSLKFVVHFFSLEKVERLAKGYDLQYTREFDDPSGPFVKKLYEVVLMKPKE